MPLRQGDGEADQPDPPPRRRSGFLRALPLRAGARSAGIAPQALPPRTRRRFPMLGQNSASGCVPQACSLPAGRPAFQPTQNRPTGATQTQTQAEMCSPSAQLVIPDRSRPLCSRVGGTTASFLERDRRHRFRRPGSSGSLRWPAVDALCCYGFNVVGLVGLAALLRIGIGPGSGSCLRQQPVGSGLPLRRLARKPGLAWGPIGSAAGRPGSDRGSAAESVP